jgi:hypothetical protein
VPNLFDVLTSLRKKVDLVESENRTFREKLGAQFQEGSDQMATFSAEISEKAESLRVQVETAYDYVNTAVKTMVDDQDVMIKTFKRQWRE